MRITRLRGKKTTEHVSQNITNKPRTDAGKKGTPAKESRQKSMMTGVSNMPSPSDQMSSAVEWFRVQNQTQVPNEVYGSIASCGRREGWEENENRDEMNKMGEDIRCEGGREVSVSKQISTRQEKPREKPESKRTRRDLDIHTC